MKIALIQQQAGADPDRNLRRAVAAFEEAARGGARLVAFPELAFLPFLPQVPAAERPEFRRFAQPVPGPLTEEFAGLARRFGIVTVLNLFETDGRDTFDSSPVIDADGRLLGTTRMVHIMDGQGFHERGYYAPGRNSKLVYETAVGKVGVIICYDRHFPEITRAVGLAGAEIVVIPQAGIIDEWGEGVYEGEVQIASLQNGYFGALCNRVGRETVLHFSGESFVTDPLGRVVARAPRDADHILFAECDYDLIGRSPAKKHFLPDRRPEPMERQDRG
ncbi:MAG: nitrilase-related carbon-nitrogen hydrolase [Candidatus Aminicenantales bacterium]